MLTAEQWAETTYLERELARRELLAFTRYTSPSYEAGWHHERLARELDAVLAGHTKRLIVNMPPQNGKSELVSRRFPAFALGKNPHLRIIHGSYNADLARDMSRDVKRVMGTAEYQQLFPLTRLGSAKDPEVNMADQFDIVNAEGSYRAAGVGQGIAGKSMMLGIIDDPIKSRAEAESEAYRRLVWNWYVSDFRTRSMGDQTAIVLVQTRWHEDDLAGRLLALAKRDPMAEQWRVVSFPAVVETLDQLQPGDPRSLGDALWPTRFSKAWLAQTKATSGLYDWSALYQQTPVPAGGAMAQRAWFKIGRPMGTLLRRCRCWDLAGTKPVAGRDPDWTVGALIGQYTGGDWCVEHVIRVRETAHHVDALMKQTALADGRSVLVREWQDPGAAGKSVIENHRVMLAGFDYAPLPSSGEKSTRWRPFFVQGEGGHVYLAPGGWNTEFLDEMQVVPYGAHDDQSDAVAGGFNALVEYKDFGPSAGAVLPGAATVSGPRPDDWRAQYFRR